MSVASHTGVAYYIRLMAVCKLGLIGAGGIARAHVTAARESRDVVCFAAVADPNPQARAAVADAAGAKAYSDIDELLADSKVAGSLSGLVVATMPSVRQHIVARAISSGLHVMVEKPLAHTLADARELAAMAQAAPDRVAAVAYCHRFTPGLVEMRRLARAGDIGRVIRFENTFACWHPTLRDKWMSDPAVSGGGSFFDTGCHSIDLYHHLCGRGSVAGAALAHEWPGRGDTNATVLLRPRSDDGAAGVIMSGWQEPARFTVTLVGTTGLLAYDFDKPTELLRIDSLGAAPRTITVETHEVRFERQLQAFAAAIGGDGEARQRLASFADGMSVNEVIDQAYHAAGRGAPPHSAVQPR